MSTSMSTKVESQMLPTTRADWAERGFALLTTLVEAVGGLPENAKGTVNGQALNRAYELASDYIHNKGPT